MLAAFDATMQKPPEQTKQPPESVIWGVTLAFRGHKLAFPPQSLDLSIDV